MIQLTVTNKATNRSLYYQLVYFFKRNNPKIIDQTLSLVISYLTHPAHNTEFFKELISIGLFEELKVTRDNVEILSIKHIFIK